MSTNTPGARWRQLRAKTLSTPQGRRSYDEGFQQAQTSRDTMRLIDSIRADLGVSRSELARRLDKSQPTVARLLTHGKNPTLDTVDQVLRNLGIRARLIIETGEPDFCGDGLVVEVKGKPVEFARAKGRSPQSTL
jgi:ribosome-binding protein aMBF1 (putative translation factor)